MRRPSGPSVWRKAPGSFLGPVAISKTSEHGPKTTQQVDWLLTPLSRQLPMFAHMDGSMNRRPSVPSSSRSQRKNSQQGGCSKTPGSQNLGCLPRDPTVSDAGRPDILYILISILIHSPLWIEVGENMNMLQWWSFL